jgi:hypothetical protein
MANIEYVRLAAIEIAASLDFVLAGIATDFAATIPQVF